VLQKNREIIIRGTADGHSVSFDAMASPCELLVATDNAVLVNKLGEKIANEVWRIEDKYSRYDPKSQCSKINTSNGKAVAIDQETYLLLNFADTCYQLSDGVFDLTSGVLRKVWHFDGSENVPTKDDVSKELTHVGWQNIHYQENALSMPTGMEIDFGGIGKEYAVDRAIILAKETSDVPILVNLGGDLAATAPRKPNIPWQIGVEHPGFIERKTMVISLYQGALATSGDAKRFLIKNNIRYSHILNAKTGWPVTNAPKSMTVAAPQCIQAGILATLALMQGESAEDFLSEQEVKFWAVR
jgi:thiamine biosynthesis lipoprotein